MQSVEPREVHLLISELLQRLSADGQLGRRAALIGPHKIESTLRYVGIEVDNALAIAEQVDIYR